MDKDTIKQLADHDAEINGLLSDVKQLKSDSAAREKKEIVREWLYTKCIWVWTMILGWCFMAGVFMMEHYEKVSLVVIAGLKAIKDSGK